MKKAETETPMPAGSTAQAPDEPIPPGPLPADGAFPAVVDPAPAIAPVPDPGMRLGHRSFYPLLPTLREKEEELVRVYDSTSWRITRPIRALKDFFLGR